MQTTEKENLETNLNVENITVKVNNIDKTEKTEETEKTGNSKNVKEENNKKGGCMIVIGNDNAKNGTFQKSFQKFMKTRKVI